MEKLFSNLNPGDIFTADGKIWVKTAINGVMVTAVSLSDGRLNYNITPDKPVTHHPNAKMILN